MGMSRYHNTINMVVLDKNLEVMRLEMYHKLTYKCTYKSRLDLSEKLEMLTSVFIQIMASQTAIKPPKKYLTKYHNNCDSHFSNYRDIDSNSLS